MNNEIVILREAIKKIVPMLAGRGLVVTQMGTQAYVQPHPVTGLPHRVNIPLLPDNAEPDFVMAVQGFIDHEVAHVLFTDFLYKAREKSPRLHSLHNIVEDSMIERMMGEEFQGSKRNIARLSEFFLKNITMPAVRAAKSEQDEFDYLLVVVVRALAGHQIWADFMEEHKFWDHRLVKELMKRLSDKTKARFPKLASTEETYEVAREIEDILYPPPPPAPPQPPEQQEEKDDQQSNGKPEEQESEDTDGEDDQDHSEEEQSSDDGKGKGEREHDDEKDNEDASGGDGESDEEDKENETGDGDSEGNEGGSKEEADEEDGEGDAADDSDGQSDADQDRDEDAGEKDSDGSGSESEENAGDEPEENEGSGSPDEDDGDDADDQDGEGQSSGSDDDRDEGESDDAPEGSDPSQGAPDEANDDQGADAPDGDEDEADQSAGDGGDDEHDDEQPGEGGSDDSEGDEAEEDEDESGSDPTSGLAIEAVDKDGEDEDDSAQETPDGDAPAGIGGDQGLNPFAGMAEDALEEKDLSSALVKLIVKEAIEACHRAEYTVFTRDYDVIRPLHVPEGGCRPKWMVDLDEESRTMTGVMQKDIERMLAAQARVFNIAGQRSGRLNSAGLHRLTAGDARVFSRREEIRAKNTAVTLLTDCSGSMKGAPMGTAMSAAYALTAVLERCNIPSECMGFTTAMPSDQPGAPMGIAEFHAFNNDVQRERAKMTGVVFSRTSPLYMPIFKDFNERINSEVKKRFAYQRKIQPFMGANIDGESLEYAAMRLLKRKEERKVIFVLSDGFPAGARNSSQHLKYMVERLTKMGFEIVGIGIKSEAPARFYDNYVILDEVADLPKAVMGELKRILMK